MEAVGGDAVQLGGECGEVADAAVEVDLDELRAGGGAAANLRVGDVEELVGGVIGDGPRDEGECHLAENAKRASRVVAHDGDLLLLRYSFAQMSV